MSTEKGLSWWYCLIKSSLYFLFWPNLPFQGHCNPPALSSLSHLFVRQISQIRLVKLFNNSQNQFNKSECEKGRAIDKAFAEVGTERAQTPASQGLLLPPRPSPPPHPLRGKPSRDGGSICWGGFCAGCQSHFLRMQLNQLNVSKRGLENVPF